MKFNNQDIEKYVTAFAYIAVILSIIYVYLTTKVISPDAIYFSTIVGSFMVGRKIASFYKPNQYYFQGDASNSINSSEITTMTSETTETSNTNK
jgi:hypothetical protein